MANNLKIDDHLVEDARTLGHHRTKEEAVTAALEEYVQRRKQQQIIALFGTIDFDPAYNYKHERHRKRS